MINNHVTNEDLKRELKNFKKEILDGVKDLLSTHLDEQERHIDAKLEDTKFWSSIASRRNFDTRLEMVERHLGLETPPRR